jgi:hypothetical protein
MVATQETDAELRKKYRTLGNRARRNSVRRDECPYDGLVAKWWLEGWDGVAPEIAKAQ